jgi:hypothetical protein
MLFARNAPSDDQSSKQQLKIKPPAERSTSQVIKDVVNETQMT